MNFLPYVINAFPKLQIIQRTCFEKEIMQTQFSKPAPFVEIYLRKSIGQGRGMTALPANIHQVTRHVSGMCNCNMAQIDALNQPWHF
ncbi:hypothetical protein CEXT_329461 [Caerostris extrusa]|uniref:Uncharacterized protein n=1 Tax=Caerostris extrusa TaxID=172846 RepID=A0AAV4NJ56_CAEEX|nr:hypothetical protein CEXT_329461 [Caerostris extrusa]